MSNKFEVMVPYPYDVESSWVSVSDFDTKEEAIAFVRKNFGADENGKIDTVFKSEVMVPCPYDVTAPWMSVENFETKKEAIAFVRNILLANSKGKIDTVFERSEEDGEDGEDE